MIYIHKIKSSASQNFQPIWVSKGVRGTAWLLSKSATTDNDRMCFFICKQRYIG